ncbi:MAG: methyl-accepting chemotaxis protein, partial [Oceanidesulfovibrio sp.]
KATLVTSHTGMEATRQNRRDMDLILERIGSVRSKTEELSEKASLIEQIITFVADLSDRSQILAVNAAIEAAKAGEAGAGFEEVALEMRRLATESKDATVRTRRILLDIQESISATSAATRESTTVVEAASQELVKAETAINELSESLARAAQSSSEIAATQEEEYSGMLQIGEAMEAIRTASKQSSDVSDKLATDSISLDELNERLERLLGRYRF